ncbi:substrate-binding domain-containing protein [Massilia sp. 9096]|uniref:substrate-binding domain-containing protein n=1 Tax=Massilia sp. 9096 TaxID=1500894 RepID=UPI00068B439B|nr:substrate-binding domain-containing protein [Massilia sp. 9096]
MLAAGSLRDEIGHGRAADVFASASVEHTEALARAGLLAGSVVFAYNDLCVVARPQLGLNADNLLDVLARPGVRLATSTPKLDPMGDYTWQFFGKADAYVMYCTNAASTRRALPGLAVVRIPAALNVRSAYGIGARPGFPDGARFVDFVLGPDGKRILAGYGFD